MSLRHREPGLPSQLTSSHTEAQHGVYSELLTFTYTTAATSGLGWEPQARAASEADGVT